MDHWQYIIFAQRICNNTIMTLYIKNHWMRSSSVSRVVLHEMCLLLVDAGSASDVSKTLRMLLVLSMNRIVCENLLEMIDLGTPIMMWMLNSIYTELSELLQRFFVDIIFTIFDKWTCTKWSVIDISDCFKLLIMNILIQIYWRNNFIKKTVFVVLWSHRTVQNIEHLTLTLTKYWFQSLYYR